MTEPQRWGEFTLHSGVWKISRVEKDKVDFSLAPNGVSYQLQLPIIEYQTPIV
jgi:hypothetical protein